MLDFFKKQFFKKKWRHLNKHNLTVANCVFDEQLVRIGNYTYGGLNVLSFNKDSQLHIGNFCSIGPDVTFVLSADHYLNHLSSYPYRVKVLNESFEGVSKGNIIVHDDVWIGCKSVILSGINIGRGAVVAAGAVVSRDVPPYSIVGGIPAKIIKYRFSKDVIDYLMTLDYESLTESTVRDNIDKLYIKLDDMSLDEIKTLFEWFPKKIS